MAERCRCRVTITAGFRSLATSAAAAAPPRASRWPLEREPAGSSDRASARDEQWIGPGQIRIGHLKMVPHGLRVSGTAH